MTPDQKRGEMPFLDHLEEFRWRIFKILGALFVASVIGFVLVLQFGVMDLLLAPLTRIIAELGTEDASWLGMTGDGRLMFLNLTEPFFFMIKMGLLTGLILSSPIVGYQIWAFLVPAMEARERKIIVPSLAMGVVLFSLGVAMAYWIALPLTIRFLLLFGAEYFTPMLTAGFYLSFVVRILMAFGIAFELPVVVMILSVLGLTTPAFLRKKRRHAIVGITVLAAFLSPGDVITVTLAMMWPLIVLYEFSILLSAMIYRKKEENRILDSSDPPDDSIELGN